MAAKSAATPAALLAAIDELVRLVTANEYGILSHEQLATILRLDAEIGSGCAANNIEIPKPSTRAGTARRWGLAPPVHVGFTGILSSEDGDCLSKASEWNLRMRSLRIAVAAATGASETVATSAAKRPVNARMKDALEQNKDSHDWTARQFADHLGCVASTITATETWQRLQGVRAATRADVEIRTGKRQDRRRKPRASDLRIAADTDD